MDSDALVLALVAMADAAFLVYRRRRRNRRKRQERIMDSLRRAIRNSNAGKTD